MKKKPNTWYKENGRIPSIGPRNLSSILKIGIKISHNADIIEQSKSSREIHEHRSSPSDLAEVPILQRNRIGLFHIRQGNVLNCKH